MRVYNLLFTLYDPVSGESNSGKIYDPVITGDMLSQIMEMSNNEYSGVLKGLYLEAKVVELFLLQLSQYNKKIVVQSSKLKPSDIDSLHDARNYIDQNYTTPCSIIDLAKIVGINQMKLKSSSI